MVGQSEYVLWQCLVEPPAGIPSDADAGLFSKKSIVAGKMKQLVSQDAPKKIKHIQFGVLSKQDIVNMSEIEVTTRDLYTIGESERKPVANGTLDRRLGVSDKNSLCETCHLKMADCVGHYGYIKLVLPVFHVGFFKHTVAILQSICKNCATVLLEEPDRRKFLKRFRRPNLENLDS